MEELLVLDSKLPGMGVYHVRKNLNASKDASIPEDKWSSVLHLAGTSFSVRVVSFVKNRISLFQRSFPSKYYLKEMIDSLFPVET